MARMLAVIGVLLGGSWLLMSVASGGRVERPAARVASKPLAPIEVVLTRPDGGAPSAERGRVPVRVRIAPRRELVELRWRWELPPGVALVEGAIEGEADPVRAATTETTAVLLVPDDDRYHSADLVVRGAFETLDADGRTQLEPIAVAASLTWGQPQAPLPVVPGRDPATGLLEPRAVLPSAHRPPAGGGR